MAVTINRAAFAAARQRLADAPRAVLGAVAAELVAATPVKVGFLRASWTVAVDGAPISAGPAAEADPAGTATAARLAAEIAAAPAGARIGFRNLAPYARAVEFGTSKMAPRGFLRGTLARVPLIASEVMRSRGPLGSE